MANDEMSNELEALRKQVSKLEAERDARKIEDAKAVLNQESAAELGAVSPELSGTNAKSIETEATDFASQCQELIDTIDLELKEASPVTVLVVFALGVVVGRLLPK